MANRQALVVGLGRFGSAVAETLMSLGVEVLGIDAHETEVQRMAPHLTQARELDTTDIDALRQVGAADFDLAVVAIGDDLEASILTTSNLSELGVSEIVAKAKTAAHERILQRVGAHRVIFPEWEMGVRLGNALAGTNLIDYISLAPQFAIVEVRAPKAIAGKTLSEADLRKKHDVIVLCVKSGDAIDVIPPADRLIGAQDILVVAGEQQAVERFSR